MVELSQFLTRHDGNLLMTPTSPLVKKLEAFFPLSEPELLVLKSLPMRRKTIDPGQNVIDDAQLGRTAFVLEQGWVCSHKLLPGGKRKTIDFQIPGDLIGLRSALFRIPDHRYEALTRIELAEVGAEDLIDAFDKTPRLATAVLLAASRSEATVVEHISSIRRRSPLERTAHFLLQLYERLRLVGLSNPDGYDCPVPNHVLADALEITVAHFIRVLGELQDRGLLRIRDSKVIFDDWMGAGALGSFDFSSFDQKSPVFK
jgi:CRP-like cAMP-binding protein